MKINVTPHNQKMYYRTGLIMLGVLLIWKIILFLDFPVLNADSAWTLSKVYTNLRGDWENSTFAHYYMPNGFKVHIFEYLNYPFFKLYPVNTYTVIIHSFVLIGLSILLLYKIIAIKSNSKTLFIFTALSILTCSYTYGMRYELYCLPIILWGILLMKKEKLSFDLKHILLIFMYSVAALMHPTAGVAAAILFLFYLINVKAELKTYLYSAILGVLFIFILTSGNIIEHINLFINHDKGDQHPFAVSHFTKFIMLAPTLLVLCLPAINNKIQNLLFLIIFIVVFMFLGRSYYYFYLFAILSQLVLFNIKSNEENTYLNNKVYLGAFLGVFLYTMFVTHVSPSLSQIVNRDYGKKYREILNKTKQIAESSDKNTLIWLPPRIGMEGIKYENIRLAHIAANNASGSKVSLKGNDYLLIYESTDTTEIFKDLIDHTREQVSIELILQPTEKGLPTVGSFFRKHSSTIGLWKVQLKDAI